MPSEIFQPLIHDPLGWKQSKTSYTDHYKWRKYGSANKDKLLATYGQRYNRQLRKQRPTNQHAPVITDTEQPISRVIVLRKREDDRQPLPTCRYLPTKTPVFIVEPKRRPASATVNPVRSIDELQRPPTAPPAVQEQTVPTTEAESQPPANKEKHKRPVDADNDNSRHWLTFPNPSVPQKIIDAKQRLGQLNIPTTLARPSTASNAPAEKQHSTPPTVRPSSASASQATPTNAQHHFLAFEKRETPDELRAARHRIDKYRYHPSLDNYPPRPQTCPERRRDSPKPATPPESQHEQYSSLPPKSDVWIAENDRQPSASTQRTPSNYVQVVNCDGLPNEYATALHISNAAQAEYERNVKMSGGRRPDSLVYRLPARLPDSKSVSFITYPNQQQSTGMDNQMRQVARASDNDLGVWIRNATDKERASAMRIVQDVLNPAGLGYDKQASNRSLSATRKLGRTRTQHKFPCEICEKLLIKRHVWDLSGLDAYSCPHRP